MLELGGSITQLFLRVALLLPQVMMRQMQRTNFASFGMGKSLGVSLALSQDGKRGTNSSVQPHHFGLFSHIFQYATSAKWPPQCRTRSWARSTVQHSPRDRGCGSRSDEKVTNNNHDVGVHLRDITRHYSLYIVSKTRALAPQQSLGLASWVNLPNGLCSIADLGAIARQINGTSLLHMNKKTCAVKDVYLMHTQPWGENSWARCHCVG